MTSFSVPLLKLLAVGSIDLWGYKPTGFQKIDQSLLVSVSPFDPGFALLITHMQMKLQGPHFAVASGFSSVSQQKSFPVPKAPSFSLLRFRGQ